MTEYCTEAIILDIEDYGESDYKIHCYTKELGCISAKAKSARKITSKLAGHLQPLTYAHIRIVEKTGHWQVVDAVTLQKIKRSLHKLAFLHVVKELAMESEKDAHIWGILMHSIVQERKEPISYKPLLTALGFGIEFAECARCEARSVVWFSKKEHIFLCKKCEGVITAKRPAEQKDFIAIEA